MGIAARTRAHRLPECVCIGGAIRIVATPVALEQLHVQDSILDVPCALLLLDLCIPLPLQCCALPKLHSHSAGSDLHLDLHRNTRNTRNISQSKSVVRRSSYWMLLCQAVDSKASLERVLKQYRRSTEAEALACKHSVGSDAHESCIKQVSAMASPALRTGSLGSESVLPHVTGSGAICSDHNPLPDLPAR